MDRIVIHVRTCISIVLGYTPVHVLVFQCTCRTQVFHQVYIACRIVLVSSLCTFIRTKCTLKDKYMYRSIISIRKT